MKILVGVKQVADSECPVRVDDNGGWVRTNEFFEFRMNRLDEYAIEEAVLIKEALSDTEIDAVTVGPMRSTEVLKRSIGMGVNNGIHITMESEEYRTSFETAAVIADYARDKSYDLIFTGAMSEDNMQGQVGPMIAARLALPWATAVVFEKIAPDRKTVYIEREIEGGARESLELQLPAVLSIQSGLNRPRYPSLSNLLRANQQELVTIAAADLSPPAPLERIFKLFHPSKTREGRVLLGSPTEKAEQLITILHNKSLL